ncbi:MAG: DUF4175 family protein [Flavobacteriaceae bacterium]|nr:DUF4175 family protein [Flavobacteriaceae bacterium]
MTKFQHIQSKLSAFIKKYYTNELLKGLILFFSFGLLYLIFTLFVEHFLWLRPTARTLLFWSFILIEFALLTKYIVLPIIKLFGLQKGISYKDASKIIGKHFYEVDDKLLNVLQLYENSNPSELLLASIEQKSYDLEPIPFKQAINFSKNKKYLKYLAIPIMIWLVTFLTNKKLFNESLNRIVHYQKAYEPPAPFSFNIETDKLTTLQGNPFTLNIKTLGKIIPENVKIHFNNESYFLKEESLGNFSHTFSNLTENKTFYIEANGVQSKDYEIKVIKTPTISNLELFLNYPNYTLKTNETIKNTGNAIIPEGTTVIWEITTKNTHKVVLRDLNDSVNVMFKKTEKNNFRHTIKIKKKLDYVIKSSNTDLKDFENLQYQINVIKDEYPKIIIKTDIDSISRGNAQFIGQISDDYGVSDLQLKYYDKTEKNKVQNHSIIIKNNTFQEFYYLFPKGLNLKKGIDYEFYFELFDNDAVNGNKSVKTKTFQYRNKTDKELNEDILKEQKENLDDLNSATKNHEKLNKSLEDFSKKIKSKSEMDWQDKKNLNQFLKRQKQYQEMLQRNTNKLQNNLNELKREDNPVFEEKKEDLKKRLEEMREMQKREKLLDELKKLAEKLDKENFLKKLDKLTQKNKQDEKSLERILELTKRFYVEKKAEEIANKLQELAKKQKELATDKENSSKKQKELNTEFEKIKEELKDLQKQNKALKKPMDIPKKEEEQKAIDEDIQKAAEKLKESEKESNKEQKEQRKKAAKKKQKTAANKMKKMGEKMQASMAAGEGEMFEEDIDNLRRIIENLIIFSLEQEQLIKDFSKVNATHPEFAKKLKKQQVLKEHFEHIDDSIYSLSLRMRKLSAKIQKDISAAHYNIDQSLENIAENRIAQGTTNQQYTMTAANNLASFLSDLLDRVQNPNMGEGEGQGMGMGKGKGKGFSLPDIIKKQGEMMSKGKGKKQGEGESGKGENKPGDGDGKGEKGNKKGSGGQGSEQMNGEIYEIYKQQNALKKAFKDMMRKAGKKGDIGNKALQQMEDLEKILLNKGMTKQAIQKMQNIKHELLKLEKANFEQGEDDKRKSETNKTTFENRTIKEIKGEKLYFNPKEILNRQALPLRSNYKKKVQEYFQKID